MAEVDEALSVNPNPSSEWHWRFLVLKSEILMRQGLYEDSLSLIQEDVPQSLARTDVAVWQLLTKGSDLARLGRDNEASGVLSQARSLAESVQPQLIEEATLRQGTLYWLQGQLAQGLAAYRTTLDLARRQNDPYMEIAALGSLGMLTTRMERYDEAVDWNKLALQRAKLIGDLRSLAKIEGNIAWAYKRVGDLENAVAANRDAEKDALRAGLQQDRVLSLLNAASALLDLDDYSPAEAETREALRLAKEIHDSGDAIYCDLNLALIALATDRLPEAQQDVDQAIELEASTPDQSQKLDIRLISAQVAARANRVGEAEKTYLEIMGQRDIPTSVKWIALAGLAELHAREGKAERAEKEFVEAISTISKAWEEIEQDEFRLSFLTGAIDFYDAYVNFLIERKRPMDALKVADRSRAQTLEHGLSPKADGKAEIQEAARPEEIARKWNATLLFYWLGEQRSHLWVITPTKVSLLPMPARSEIDARVKSYLEAFPGPRDPLETGNADGKKLYETLIGPAEKLIPKNSRVVILPDGGLNSLNFETLIVSGDKPHYWIEDVTLLTANSLALLAKASPTAPPADASLFLMGDPLQASPDFPSLPQAGKEVGLVQNYFPAGRRSVLTAAQATPSAFLSGKPEEFSYLHFATHGTASTLRPLESAVILSPEGDAYKLYARDIVQHPVHAYLVTISACNGAGMKTYAGEGLVGLAWAFLRAGAHNVIGGLWEVSNASTPQLMDELYKGLNDGKDPATALRNAKLSLVHSTGNYHRPYYWGPFQLYAGS